MKKMLIGCLSVFILMAIAKVLIAQPTMEEGVSENAAMMEEGNMMMESGNMMMEEGNMMHEEGAY